MAFIFSGFMSSTIVEPGRNGFAALIAISFIDCSTSGG